MRPRPFDRISLANANGQGSFVKRNGTLEVLAPLTAHAVDAMLDTVKLFGMGFSWGGFESLVIPFDCDLYRTATKWAPGGPTLRLHIGLENVEDLKADLDRGFAAFNAAR